jgi:hypothetical protein
VTLRSSPIGGDTGLGCKPEEIPKGTSLFVGEEGKREANQIRYRWFLFGPPRGLKVLFRYELIFRAGLADGVESGGSGGELFTEFYAARIFHREIGSEAQAVVVVHEVYEQFLGGGAAAEAGA